MSKIKSEPSDEVQRLRQKIAELQGELAELKRAAAQRSAPARAEQTASGARDEAAALLSGIFASSLLGVHWWAADGRILEANDAFLKIVGYSRADLVSGALNWRTLTPPEFADRDEAAAIEIRERGVCIPFEKEYLRKDGSRVHVLLGPHAVSDDRSQGMAFVLDISRQKAAESALREMSHLLEAIVAASPVSIGVVGTDLCVTLWSPASERIFGWKSEDVVGKLLPIVPPELHEELREVGERLMRGEAVHALETRRLRSDGTQVEVQMSIAPLHNAGGEYIGALGIAEDISQRKEAERALRESELKWRTLIDSSPDLILVIDRSGTISFINRLATGLPVTEVIGTNVFDYLMPRFHELARQAIDRVLVHGETAQLEVQIVGLRGVAPWYDVRVRLLRRDGNQTSLMAVISDISARKQAEEQLAASEVRFRTLCEASPLGIFECDERGMFSYANPEWCRISGLSYEESLDGGWVNAVHPDDRQPMRRLWREFLQGARPWIHEHRLLTPAGQVRWVRGRAIRLAREGRPDIFVGTVEDYTERRVAELAQYEVEQRFRAFMDNNSAVAFMKDEAGRWVYANQPFRQAFRMRDQDFLGKTDFDMFDPQLAAQLREVDTSVLESGQPLQLIESVPTPDGVRRHWLAYKFPVVDSLGRKFLGGVALDITERMQTEEDLRRARDELEQRVAERTASLVEANTQLQDEVAERKRADAALRDEQQLLRQLLFTHEADRKLIAYEIHDGLVQYVAAALMHLESVASAVRHGQKRAADRPNQGQADKLEAAASLLRSTISEARRMIRGLQPMVLDESGIVAAIEYLIGEHGDGQVVDFHHAMPAERLTPLLESALFRICQEALTNARKYSQTDRVVVRLTERQGWVRLEIADQGVGFDPHRLEGSSFGLQGIRERARLMGGQATIDSAPRRGTRIVVEMPVDLPVA